MNTSTAALCLIVDDDEMLRVLTRAALEAAGFVVEELPDGDNLAEDFRRLRPRRDSARRADAGAGWFCRLRAVAQRPTRCARASVDDDRPRRC